MEMDEAIDEFSLKIHDIVNGVPETENLLATPEMRTSTSNLLSRNTQGLANTPLAEMVP
jgi:hypothetical protein